MKADQVMSAARRRCSEPELGWSDQVCILSVMSVSVGNRIEWCLFCSRRRCR
jgi:hypothetical protein